MNEHPEILLADFVDGTLPPDARAEVEAHLTSCALCREEVALAEEARGALATLPEVPAPEGLTFAVRRRARRPPSPRIGRWVAATAAAAVVAAAGFAVIRSLTPAEEEATGLRGQAGGGGVAGGEESAPQAGPESAQSDARTLFKAPPPTYTESNQDYDTADLAALGRRLRDQARGALREGLGRTATVYYRRFDLATLNGKVGEAIRCSLREVPPEQLLVPFAIEAASFQGEPAYVTAFLQGPAPDQPYDRVVIWIVSRETCSLRSLASQRL